MTLRIDHPEADKLAAELASYTGETIPQAVVAALRERLEREKHGLIHPMAEELLRIGYECADLPVLDDRKSEEILGYDDRGVPV